jgi:hypothetical protein
LSCERVKKAEENLKRKEAAITSARDAIAQGGSEVHGMQKELADIHKRREKVRPSHAQLGSE